MHNLALIPARGGSKRIPGKNTKDFLGKPIISYSIEVALKSGLFEEVMVSTDSQEIAVIAQNWSAKIPFLRSMQNSNDFASLSDVIDEVKTKYSEIGRKFDNICCILPTSPLLTVDTIIKGYNLLNEKNVDSVRPVVRFSYPIMRALTMSDNRVKMLFPEHKLSRSQDLQPTYHDAGQFYWMRYSSGLKGENKYGFEISEIECQDIDTLEDWAIAEFKFKYLSDHNAI